eukprot:GHUV01022631.1.p1 GENE.GHUV01022631.1~~GHUV01022631.1.p1  ORF type:complete len:469 (+),score=134.31 GHUV01022631.1:165-1571(+)
MQVRLPERCRPAKSPATHPRPRAKLQKAGRLRVAQLDTIQAEEAPEAAAVEHSIASSNGALSNGHGAVHAVTRPRSATATVQRPSTLQRGSRPYIPQVDIPQLLETLLGDPEKTLKDNTVLGSALVADGGPARLFSPLVPKSPGAPAAEDLPLMFYMPGIDGTGLAAYRQFPRLTRAFDLRCLIIPRTDRSTFEQLVEDVAALVKQELDQADAGRPVYLLGESFGAIMSMALAIKLGNYIDRLVLVNPASSFSNSIWPQAGPLLAQLPEDVYKLLPFALAPVMSNPISMAMNDVDDRAPLLQQGSDLMYGLIDLAPQLAALRLVLPPETLAWRLELLKQGSQWIRPRLKDVKQRVLVLSGEQVCMGNEVNGVPHAWQQVPCHHPLAIVMASFISVMATSRGSHCWSLGVGSSTRCCSHVCRTCLFPVRKKLKSLAKHCLGHAPRCLLTEAMRCCRKLELTWSTSCRWV